MREILGRFQPLRRERPQPNRRGCLPVVAQLGIGICSLAALGQEARADFKVDAPSIDKGVLSMEHSSSYAHDHAAARDREISLKHSVAYGITSFWQTELEGEVGRDAGEGERTRFRFVEWKNTFRFTGEDAWLAVGGIVEYAHDLRRGSPDTVHTAILLEKELAPVTLTLNLLFEKEFGRGASAPVGLGYAFQARHEFTRSFALAFEAYGASEAIESLGLFREHDHRIGPVLLGELGLGAASLKYELGYLVGVGGASPSGTVKWLVGLDVPF